jgi:hypothetical protein
LVRFERLIGFVSAVKEDRPLPGAPLADPGVRNYRTGLPGRTRDGYGEVEAERRGRGVVC